jgi:DNA repair protein RadC
MNATLRKNQLKLPIYNAGDLYPVMQSILMQESKVRRAMEHFWVASLDTQYRLLNVELVNIGAANRAGVQPPEVFRIAIYKAAMHAILVHNQPGDELQPSAADKDFTDRMLKVGKLLNIDVMDHLIISETNYTSFSDTGIMAQLAKSGLYEVTRKESEEMLAWKYEIERKKGEDKAKREMAVKLFKDGFDVEAVVKYTGLRKSSVEKMKREM